MNFGRSILTVSFLVAVCAWKKIPVGVIVRRIQFIDEIPTHRP
jgi:hypothetical protein